MYAKQEIRANLKHEFKVIYIFAEKNCTIFLGRADRTCERETFIVKELRQSEKWTEGTSRRVGPAQCTAASVTCLTLAPPTRINRYCTIDLKKTKKNLSYANKRTNHQSASNLWAQSETLLTATSLSLSSH